jgi:hypothetical protein
MTARTNLKSARARIRSTRPTATVRRGIVAALLVTGLVVVPGAARATVLWTVCQSGCNFTSINAAVNESNAGDLIEVMPGTYAEDVVVTVPLHRPQPERRSAAGQPDAGRGPGPPHRQRELPADWRRHARREQRPERPRRCHAPRSAGDWRLRVHGTAGRACGNPAARRRGRRRYRRPRRRKLTTGLGAASRKPTISRLAETRTVFAVAPTSTPIRGRTSAASSGRGTTFLFGLDQPATVTVVITTSVTCRRTRMAQHLRCTRSVARLTRSAHAGFNKLPFSGRIRG